MAEAKKIFEGTPASVVFEASQRALRALDLDITDEDHARHQIFAERKKTFWQERAEVDLWVAQIGQSSEVRVKKLPQAMLDITGKELVNSILSKIEVELEQMNSAVQVPQEYAESYDGSSQTLIAAPTERLPPARPPLPRREKAEKSKSGEKFGILQLVGLVIFVHFFFGWEWLGNVTSGESSDTRAQNLISTLNGYAQASPNSIDPVDLARRLPNLTDVQLTGLEESLAGELVTARGSIYDVQAVSPSLGLDRFEVVVWQATFNPEHLPVRGTCIARSAQETSMFERLTVGQNVRITGELASIGRVLGVRVRNCIIE
ncbi:hypothetical protein [Roseicyclus mahoneyensis]|jgi:hypothetical protein|uniref:Uncharacterized protein n=1 Tax=Roseicyclus mahoneyensis TaxID=164332 RepID=A0A316H0P3_9RHOB|nr:hypothetical protein [Roseicyclus mahoneyensis]PWK60970.1 hypothetical protein C7455_103170 [Roseicyclus mahoneyensis]